MHITPRKSAMMRTAGVVMTAAVAAATLAGCTPDTSSDGVVTITLAGPNQWNTQSDTFGAEWEALIAKFEKAEPGIKVETTVLPLSSFVDTLTTQLAAGTAPELIFNQPAPSDPSLVVALDPYLAEPNPYNPDAATWLEGLNSDAYGDAQRDASGNLYWVPFNLVTTGLFYNADVLEENGVETPIESIGALLDACDVLSDAGYTPLAMDSGTIGTGWTAEVLLANLLNKYGDEWNVYDPAGQPGTSATVSTQSLVRAILAGDLDATKIPEVKEAVKLLKEIFDACVTPNWSGVTASATFVGGEEFLGGEAAMAWGTNFAISNLDAVDWTWASMPFPSVTKKDTSLSDGSAARYGAVAGGTSYMIPSSTTGEKLDAAIKFLQFASSPQGNGEWVAATNAIPATLDVTTASDGLTELLSGEWAKPRLISIGANAPAADSGSNLWEGYLLGTRTLDEQLVYLETNWVAWGNEVSTQAGLPDGWWNE